MIKTIKKKLLYENKWVRFWRDDVEFPGGGAGEYTYMERADAGPMIIAMTSDERVVVLREWRYPIKDWTWCFPFGGIEEGEDMFVAAKREFREETGYEAAEWVKLGELRIDPGANAQVTPVYLAQKLTHVGESKDGGEVHEVHELTLEEVNEKISSGEVSNGWLLAGLSLLRSYITQ